MCPQTDIKNVITELALHISAPPATPTHPKYFPNHLHLHKIMSQLPPTTELIPHLTPNH